MHASNRSELFQLQMLAFLSNYAERPLERGLPESCEEFPHSDFTEDIGLDRHFP